MNSTPEQAVTQGQTPCNAVLFDGSCPLCSTEIAMYRKLPARTELQWVDVSAPAFSPPPGVTRTQLMQRFHASTPDGQLLSGARAFVYVWSQLPGWRHLARIASVPGMLQLMEAGYRTFLVFRPWMQRTYRSWHRRQQHQTNL